MKLFQQQTDLNWTPANWNGSKNPPTMGPFTFPQHPIPAVVEANEILQKTLSDVSDAKVCFDQTTYDAYLFAFQQFSNREPVFFVGPPGTCKTFVLSKISADLGLPLLKIPALDMDPVRARRIMFGGLSTTDSAPWKLLQERHDQGVLRPEEMQQIAEFKTQTGTTQLRTEDWQKLSDKFGYVSAVAVFMPGSITKAMKHGYVLFVDELNKFTPAALTDLTNLLSGQSIKLENGDWVSIKDAHPNFRMAFAMNPAGPMHPDREPLVRELMSRLSRSMMIIPEMDNASEQQFLNYLWQGEQPTIKLPTNKQFRAPNNPKPLIPDEVTDICSANLKKLANLYVKTRHISRELSQKMEKGENDVIPRNATTETWTFDRRDIIAFAREFSYVLATAPTKEMMSNQFRGLVQRHCAQHFMLYNQEQGAEVMNEFMTQIGKLGLLDEFELMISKLQEHTTTTQLSTDAVQKGLTNSLKTGERVKSCPHLLVITETNEDQWKKYVPLLETRLLSDKKITAAQVAQAKKSMGQDYPLGMAVIEHVEYIPALEKQWPELKGTLTVGQTLVTIPQYILDQTLPIKNGHELN